jgi:hypothetical protein
MRWLRCLALLIGFSACLAPMAHVLELPNKVRLDSSLWLAVQQHLYAGWGPLIGAPTEIGGLIISLILLAANRRHARRAVLFGLAGAAYGAMLLSFFLLNAPVNGAVNTWTAAHYRRIGPIIACDGKSVTPSLLSSPCLRSLRRYWEISIPGHSTTGTGDHMATDRKASG